MDNKHNGKKPLITIIIPIYNSEKYLKRCINSVINQSYNNLDIILVDDGSTDKSLLICKRFSRLDCRIQVIHKNNGGLSSARNAGLKKAKGDYIAFVDSDDWVAQDMYQYLLKLLLTTKSQLVMCKSVSANKSNEKEPIIKEKITINNQREILKKYFRVNTSSSVFSPCNRLYKKEILENIYFTDGMYNEDVDFTYKIFSNINRIAISNKMKYFYYQQNVSITRNSLKEKDKDLLKMWDIVIMLTKERTPEFISYAKINRIRAEFTLLNKAALYGVDKSYYNFEEDKKEMILNLKNNYFKLLKYKGLSLNRKIILTFMCINYNIVKIIFSIYDKIMNKTNLEI